MAHKSLFRKLWVKMFSSANSSSVTLTDDEMILHLAFLSFEILVVKKVPKTTILRGGDIKWRIRAFYESCGLKFFLPQKVQASL